MREIDYKVSFNYLLDYLVEDIGRLETIGVLINAGFDCEQIIWLGFSKDDVEFLLSLRKEEEHYLEFCREFKETKEKIDGSRQILYRSSRRYFKCG